MAAIYKREMRAYFTSPIGYLFAALFLAANGVIFSMTTLQAGKNSSTATYFTLLLFELVIVLPLLTMKQFSEERKLRTEQLLLTAPCSLTAMVVAKFLAAYTIFGGTFLLSCLNLPVLAFYATTLDTASIFGCIFAVLLISGAFLAVGLFLSALTESQLVAAISTVAVLAALVLISFLNASIKNYALRTVLSWISVYSRFSYFTDGIFDFSALVYYASFIVVFLFLTVRVFEKRRWA